MKKTIPKMRNHKAWYRIPKTETVMLGIPSDWEVNPKLCVSCIMDFDGNQNFADAILKEISTIMEKYRINNLRLLVAPSDEVEDF